MHLIVASIIIIIYNYPIRKQKDRVTPQRCDPDIIQVCLTSIKCLPRPSLCFYCGLFIIKLFNYEIIIIIRIMVMLIFIISYYCAHAQNLVIAIIIMYIRRNTAMLRLKSVIVPLLLVESLIVLGKKECKYALTLVGS